MTLAQSYDIDTTTRLSTAVADAVQQLTRPRLVHTDIRNDHGGIESIHTEEHPALIDLLEHVDAMQRGTGRGGSHHTRTPIDIEAHELLKEIRRQVSDWLQRHGVTRSKDLKADLLRWTIHYDNGVARGTIPVEEQRAIRRRLDGWVERIEAKFDPDEKVEFTDPCPAIRINRAGDPHRCGARKVPTDPDDRETDWAPAIDLNITQLTARCRACGTRWEGERGLMQLRYEANLAALEEDAT
jgi:hypothetical protein